MGILKIEHIVKMPNVCGGEPRIDGTRMRVHDLAIYYQAEMTVEEICESFDLTPGQVHAALSYYSVIVRKSKVTCAKKRSFQQNIWLRDTWFR